MMIVTAAAMFRGRLEQTASAERTAPFALIMVEGVVVGAATGLVGAGGGFLVVPALVLLGGMPIHQAVGTSLLVISLKSFAGFWGYAGHVTIDLELTATVTVAAMVGSLVGAYYAQKVPAQRLRQGVCGLCSADGNAGGLAGAGGAHGHPKRSDGNVGSGAARSGASRVDHRARSGARRVARDDAHGTSRAPRGPCALDRSDGALWSGRARKT